MNEHKCVLSASCCGCSLRSGTLAIGILGVIGCILNIISGIYLGVKGFADGWITMAVSIIHLIVNILLIQGVKQERRSFVMLWVWVSIICVVLYSILAVVTIIVSLNIAYAITVFIVVGVIIYCILVVRSYALSLGATPTVA
ncbi:uncharacterized protein LOC121876069 [Homarus americanus]|uniref:uncharacterized protein LOC121876069 n=1 Tax=Homarus americanus TaxID=6706 RepID=UPI001C45E998|nr:uncharacterized protein LOC121876069 [Homarus americanus]